jgi:H+/gluconate symporter-like permease
VKFLREDKRTIGELLFILPVTVGYLIFDAYRNAGINNFRAIIEAIAALVFAVLTVILYHAVFKYMHAKFKTKSKADVIEDLQAIGIVFLIIAGLFVFGYIFVKAIYFVRTGHL